MSGPSDVARLCGVTHRYRETIAVDGIDLRIPAGRMAGFVGPDGVGKSTVLGLIAGVRKIQQGRVEVLGGDMAEVRYRRAARERIAYMPQGLGRNLYPALSVFENVDFFGRLFGQSREEREWRIEELLASTGLAPFRDRPMGKLSGGMKQKLGLCCALIHEPEILILDEPTTGVDALSRRLFWELIDRIRLRHPGLSVLIATAYMEEAERFDWLAAMYAGKLLATGTPGEFKERSGAGTLERAFVELLPEEIRRADTEVKIPPRRSLGGAPAIEARGLTRRFNHFVAVDRVSFRIERGEIFGFLGSNGCGKTTTMKMLAGLLPVSGGEALLFGRALDARDLETRKRVGFMSQSFSLYTELTVRQNLELHARLFHLSPERVPVRIAELVGRFGLEAYLDELAANLPLGIKQRLSLAVAVIHEPQMLILDEPTSGVDPVARDGFWKLLIELSREQDVTIFISTHFMNEAERCDRISLMHAGKVLAQDTPANLMRERGAGTLEDAFVEYLKDASEAESTGAGAAGTGEAAREKIARRVEEKRAAISPLRRGLGRLWAYARREAVEVYRDRTRLAFALLFPVVLMIAFGYGISFDVEKLPYAVLDHDRSPASRKYLENFTGSRYFVERPPIRDHDGLERRLRSGELKLAIEIPPGFGRELKAGRQPEVGVWLDGAMPFRAETSRGYVEGIHVQYLEDLAERAEYERHDTLADIETRFLYNQEFESVFAMVPSNLMLFLILVPAMLTALGVVREKELGSITNFYSTPTTRTEFLLGKQMPYVAIALVNFACLVAMAVFLFDVPVKGSLAALTAGALLYVIATTGLGLLISTFVQSQVGAIFATAILTMMPAVQFSGMFVPVASLRQTEKLIGLTFPSTYFEQISIGAITKALGFGGLAANFAALGAIIAVYFLLSTALLRTQER